MFKVDDILTYGINGVCKVTAIEEKNLMGIKRNYLVLKPINGDRSTFYVPADNEDLLGKMRKLLSEDEINRLIDSIPGEKVLWINNEKERKERYRQIVADGNHSELIRMIKAIHLEKKGRAEKGKKLHISDERFLKEAEKILYDEFQYVLNLTEKDVVPYIFSRLETNTNK
ncbi:MAG: CarD family transcriptional regulator [Clostridia bacterium]|nr:CarD family transcriptional regulator [Clostridia bacterium]